MDADPLDHCTQSIDDDSARLFDIPRPCSVDWSDMNGDGAARLCGRCQRAVHDFSILSAEQIRALLSNSSRRVCARLDVSTVQRLGTGRLKALALSTMLTTVSVAAPVPQSVASTPPSTGVRGVVSNGNHPLPDIEIRARPQGAGAEAVTRTGEAGDYAFGDLAPGSYVMSFAGDPVSKSRRITSWDVEVEVCEGITLVLDSGSPGEWLGEVIVVVQTTNAIEGRITRQNHEQGLAEATVTLLHPANGLRQSMRTDASGRYHFGRLAPGRYEISATAPGFVARSTSVDLTTKPRQQVFSPGSVSASDTDLALCPRPPERQP